MTTSPGGGIDLRWAAMLLLGTLAGLPAVAGQEIPTAHHEVIVQEALLDVTFEPDLNLLDDEFNPDCADGLDDVDPVGGSFLFVEFQLQTQCAEVILNLTVPTGATIFRMNFTATRYVNTTATIPSQLPNLEQYYVLESPDDPAFNRQSNYFGPGAGSSEGPEVFDDTYLLPAGLRTVRVMWHFEDPGAENQVDPSQPLPTGNALSARISAIRFSWLQLPLALDPIEAQPERTEQGGQLGIIDYTLRAAIPDQVKVVPEAFDPSVALRRTALSEVRIAVSAGLVLNTVLGPRGELADEEYLLTEGGQRIVVAIPPATTATQGPGTYELRYQSTRLLPPPAPTSDPTRIYPFFFVLAFLPMVAAALAAHQTTLYVRQAEGPYRRTAWPIALAVGIVVLYYLLLLVYALFGIGPRSMSTLPLVREAVLVYIQLVLLLIMLAAAALAVSRTLMGSMRRDLEERQRKEDQLRRSNEELERFAYVASHDLQEPLRKVAGFTALLQKKYAGRLDRDADEIIGFAVDGATRMQMLIKDILAYSRVGSRELQRVQVDANAVMELVTADLGDAIKESKARITWRGLPTVRADASQLRQILQNLVENAIKYHKPGRRPIVHVSGRQDGEAWHFEVKDNGIGIPQDKHEEIFGIFRRLHGQDTRGTGIGLAVAKKAVERHNGKIWVESKPGHGSTFHFLLPRSAFDTSGDVLATARGRRRDAATAG